MRQKKAKVLSAIHSLLSFPGISFPRPESRILYLSSPFRKSGFYKILILLVFLFVKV